MLAKYFFLICVTSVAVGLTASAQESSIVTDPCFVKGALGDVENTAIKKGQLCIDPNGDVRKRTGVKDCWNFSQTVYDVNKCFKTASKKDLKNYTESLAALAAKALQVSESEKTTDFARDLRLSKMETELKALELRCDDFQNFADTRTDNPNTKSGRSCTIHSLKEAEKAWAKRFDYRTECLLELATSCRTAQVMAQAAEDKAFQDAKLDSKPCALCQMPRIAQGQGGVNRVPSAGVNPVQGGVPPPAVPLKATP